MNTEEFEAITSTRADYANTFTTYLATGLGAPLPLPHGQKVPPPKGWTGWDARYPSHPDCLEWATEHVPGQPDYRGTTQLGLRLSPNVVGFDWDCYDGKRGAETMAEATRRFGALPASPWSSAREDGSGIGLFRVPDGTVLVSQLKFYIEQPDAEPDVLSDVEVIQLHHRYMVVWPSLHPKTGDRYTWRNTAGPDQPPHLDDLPDLPQSWLDGLAGTGVGVERVNDEQVRSFLAHLTRGDCPTVNRAMHNAIAELSRSGSRHDAALSSTLKLLRLGEQGHPGVPEALGELREAFVAARLADESGSVGSAMAEFERMTHGPRGVALIASKPTNPLDKGCRCMPTTGSVKINSTSPLAGASPQVNVLAQFADASGELHLTPLEMAVERIRIRRQATRIVDAEERDAPPEPGSISLADLLAEPDDDPVYRVSELWPLGGKIVLAAPQKSGKTTTVGNIVKALVDGTPLFGALPGRPGYGGFGVQPLRADGRVFLADFELDRRMLRRWLRDHSIANPDRLHVEFFRGKVWDIRDEKVRSEWATHLRELNTEILVVDPLGPVLFALGINENDNSEVGQFLHALDSLVSESGAAELLVTHHTGHGSERSRGATVLRGWPDAEWRLMNEPMPQGQEPGADATRFFAANGRDVAVQDTALVYDAPTRHLSFGTGNRATHATEKHSPVVMEIIDADPGLNSSAFTEAVQSKVGLERNSARKVIAALLGAGAIHTHKGHKTATHYYPGRSTPGCHQD